MKVQDFIPFSPPRHTLETAYAALSAIQGEHPGVQVASVAVMFKVIADEAKLDVSTVLNQAARIIKDDDVAFRSLVSAFREYVKQEIVR